MNSLIEFSSRFLNKYYVIPIGCIVIVSIARAYIKRRKEQTRLKSYPRDVVILHQLPRGYKAPSPSPFILKLETWIRMNKIKYQNVHGFNMGPKGKVPYILYNDQVVADSDFIIEFLSNTLDKGLGKNYSDKEKGIARAFSKMTEESLFWVMVLQRYVYDRNPLHCGFSRIALLYLGHLWGKRSKSQGYGLHSKEEVYSIGRKDLKSLNDFLEGKKFLLGDEPCNEDATIFGLICHFIYHENGPMHQFIKNECPNIVSYIENMKSTYWPDWDNCVEQKIII